MRVARSPGDFLVRATPQATVRLQKALSIRRSRQPGGLHWWSVPLSPRQFLQLFASDLQDAEAMLYPATVLRDNHDTLQATPCGAGALRVGDLHGLLELADSGSIQKCSVIIFDGTLGDAEVQQIASRQTAGLEPVSFLFALEIPLQHVARFQYAFRKTGDGVKVLEYLSLGRIFGTERSRVEQQLLQHADFSSHETHHLQLVLQDGSAKLLRVDEGGRRQVQYIASGLGYSPVDESRSRWQAMQERFRRTRQSFPVNVILFAGLPAFIGFFKAKGALQRRRRRP